MSVAARTKRLLVTVRRSGYCRRMLARKGSVASMGREGEGHCFGFNMCPFTILLLYYHGQTGAILCACPQCSALVGVVVPSHGFLGLIRAFFQTLSSKRHGRPKTRVLPRPPVYLEFARVRHLSALSKLSPQVGGKGCAVHPVCKGASHQGSSRVDGTWCAVLAYLT